MKTSETYHVYRFPGPYAPGERDRIERLRFRGYKGGLIQTHRALLTSPGGAAKAATSVGLAAVLLAAWLFTMTWVVAGWQKLLSFWTEVLGIPGYVTLVRYRIADLFTFSAPYVHVKSEAPDFVAILVGAVLTIVVFLATFFLPRRHLPLVYALRVVALFQACAQLFFAFLPAAFPYGAAGYIHGVLIAGLALIALVPVLLAFTYFIFDFSLRKKAGLALIIMCYFGLLIPVQYAAHAFVLYHTSLLYLPLLFFVFGLPLDVMIFIAFYSWGASWKNNLYEEDPPRGNGFHEA